MSVLIKGMEMPKNCGNCWALDDYGDYPRCRITEEQRGYNFPIRDKRMDKCPLVEIKPHGRLVDADALKKKWLEAENRMGTDKVIELPLKEFITNGCVYDLDNAPTIIREDGT